MSHKVDLATFCYEGDKHRLSHYFEHMIMSHGYPFSRIIVIFQNTDPVILSHEIPYHSYYIDDSMIDDILNIYRIDPYKEQYNSPDKAHQWRYHVVNHLWAVSHSTADYIVFSDSDCWIVNQPDSWIQSGIKAMHRDRSIFLVSPNDGEPERLTTRISQQLFLVRTAAFRHANFTQPGYTGNPKDYDTMPEYHAMLEGRLSYYCQANSLKRYVLPPDYRYWHFNRETEEGLLITDVSKY